MRLVGELNRVFVLKMRNGPHVELSAYRQQGGVWGQLIEIISWSPKTVSFPYQADRSLPAPLFGATAWWVDDVEKRNIPPHSELVRKPVRLHVSLAGAVPRGDVRAVLVDHQGVRVRLEEIAKVVRDRSVEEGLQLCWQLLQHTPKQRDIDGTARAIPAQPVLQLAVEEFVCGEPGVPPRRRASCSGRRIQIPCVVETVDAE